MRNAFYTLALLLLGATACLGQAAPADAPAQAQTAERGEAYGEFMLGRLYEEMYERTLRSEYANRSIEHYKQALELDPQAAEISERLAEMYAKTQRIRDAVLEAQEILRRDPDNLPARRLLARIYLRTLGNLNAADRQREIVARAIEQYREILRLDPEDTEASLWLARLHRIVNDTASAEQVLRTRLEKEPENEAVLEHLTQLLLDTGRPEEAIAALERISERASTPRLLGLLGHAYLEAGRPARAEEALRRAVEAQPRDIRLRRALANALAAQDKDEAALEQYLRLDELEPDDPDTQLRLAQIYRRMKKLNLAEERLLRAREAAPSNLEVIYSEALLYEAQGRFDDAIRVLSDAVAALKPQASDQQDARRTLGFFYEQLGRLYREVENFSAAVNTFRELGALDPGQDRRARLLVADTLRMARQGQQALAEAEKLIELYPDDPAARTTHALLLAETGKAEEGAAQVRRLLAESGDERSLYLSLAQVYERGRQYEEAAQAAQQAAQLSGAPEEREVAWFLLAAIYERQGNLERAEEYFRKVLELNPRHGPALNYYGYMLAERGQRLEEAVALVERALEEEPHNGAYLDSLGWAYFQQQRFDLAEHYLLRAVERNGRDPVIRDHLGDLYFRTGRQELAAEEWERSLAAWQNALPAEVEPEKIAATERKLADVRHRLAERRTEAAKPR